MIVAYRNGRPVRLDEVAQVYDGVENDKTASSVQRHDRAIYLVDPASSRARTSSQVVDAVKALLPTLPRAAAGGGGARRCAATARSRFATRSRDVKFTLLLTVVARRRW